MHPRAGLSPSTLEVSATNMVDMLVSKFLTEGPSSSPDGQSVSEWAGAALDVFFFITLPFLTTLSFLVTGSMILIQQACRVCGPA